MVMTPRPSLIVLSSLLVLAAGCKSAPAPASASTPTSETTTPTTAAPTAVASVAPATAGTLTGTVLFKGTPPPRAKIDMSMDPACAFSGGDNLAEQYVVTGGKLANVFVYVKAGLPASSALASVPPVQIDQKGCRYLPHVAAAQQGTPVAFTNSDPAMHNVHTMAVVAGNTNLDVSEAPRRPAADPPLQRTGDHAAHSLQ